MQGVNIVTRNFFMAACIVHNHIKDDRWLRYSLGIQLFLVLLFFLTGMLANSYSLLAEGLHKLYDTTSIFITIIARILSRKGETKQYNFGLKRAEIVGALINLVSIIVMCVHTIVHSLAHPSHDMPHGSTIMLVGLVGFVVNLATAFFISRISNRNLNIKALLLHTAVDVFTSISILVLGYLIHYHNINYLDIVFSISIASYILVFSIKNLFESIKILLNVVPKGFDRNKVKLELRELTSLSRVVEIKAWRIDEEQSVVFVIIEVEKLSAYQGAKEEVKKFFRTRYNVEEVWVELR